MTDAERQRYAWINEDYEVNWTDEHPVESGECPEATDIELMTLAEFTAKYPLTEGEGK